MSLASYRAAPPRVICVSGPARLAVSGVYHTQFMCDKCYFTKISDIVEGGASFLSQSERFYANAVHQDGNQVVIGGKRNGKNALYRLGGWVICIACYLHWVIDCRFLQERLD